MTRTRDSTRDRATTPPSDDESLCDADRSNGRIRPEEVTLRDGHHEHVLWRVDKWKGFDEGRSCWAGRDGRVGLYAGFPPFRGSDLQKCGS
jgi:hypothetical protein